MRVVTPGAWDYKTRVGGEFIMGSILNREKEKDLTIRVSLSPLITKLTSCSRSKNVILQVSKGEHRQNKRGQNCKQPEINFFSGVCACKETIQKVECTHVYVYTCPCLGGSFS